MIKWISKPIAFAAVQDFLNEYSDILVPETLHLSDSAPGYTQVTFALSQTFNNKAELEAHLSRGKDGN